MIATAMTKAPQDLSAISSPYGKLSVRPKLSFKICGTKYSIHPNPPAIKRWIAKTVVNRDVWGAVVAVAVVDAADDDNEDDDDISKLLCAW